MANPIYSMFTNMMMNRLTPQSGPPQGGLNIYQQIQMVQQNSANIVDILARQGKINQSEYMQLQPYKDNPQQIYQFLMNNGHSNELKSAEQYISNAMNNVVGNFQQGQTSNEVEGSAVN